MVFSSAIIDFIEFAPIPGFISCFEVLLTVLTVVTPLSTAGVSSFKQILRDLQQQAGLSFPFQDRECWLYNHLVYLVQAEVFPILPAPSLG